MVMTASEGISLPGIGAVKGSFERSTGMHYQPQVRLSGLLPVAPIRWRRGGFPNEVHHGYTASGSGSLDGTGAARRFGGR